MYIMIISKKNTINMIINNYKRDEMNHSVVCDSLEGSEGENAKRYPMDKAPSMAWYLMKK